jgi:TolB-like protein
MNVGRKHLRASAALVVLSSVILTGNAALAQVAARTLIALTLSTGVVAICEVRQDADDYIKVYNLKRGETETYPKDPNYRDLRPNAPPPERLQRPAKKQANTGTRAIGYVPVTRMEASHLKRLGGFPDNIAAYLSWAVKGLATDKEPVIAVLPLQTPRGQKTGESLHRSEELTNALVSRKVNVVERSRLGQAVDELLGQNQVLFDPEKAQKIGKLTGAAAVVVGTLTPMGDQAEVNIRLVDVETGQIREAVSLKDVEGLPDMRMPIGRRGGVSLVGTWDMSWSNGDKGWWTFRENNTFEARNGSQGSWSREGDKFTVKAVPRGAATKKMAAAVEWHGRISPDSPTFEVSNDGGRQGTGRKR